MSKDIYSKIKLEDILSVIDTSKLSRDYIKEPMIKYSRQKYEVICKSDLKYLYIDLNLSREELSLYFNCNTIKISRMLQKHNIKKSKELILESNIRLNNIYFGGNSPFSLKENQEKSHKTMIERYGMLACKSELVKKKIRNTNEKRYGGGSPMCSKKVQKKLEQTMIERYGVTHNMKLEQTKEKSRKTKLEKYGDPYYSNPNKTKQTKLERYGDTGYHNIEKMNKTKLERYGDENYHNVEKMKETNIKKFGNSCSLHGNTEEALKIQEIVKNNKIVKYGDANYVNVEKAKQTKLERYGDENYHNIEKMKDTLLKTKGVINVFQLDEVKRKSETTCLKKYGNKRYNLTVEFQQKSHDTKKRNNSFSSSKSADKIYELLKSKFPNVVREYNNILYSYNGKCFDCDFYIQELDLYIEYQGYVTHGKEPYNPDNPEHIALVEEYKKRAEEINFKGKKKSQYLNYIEVWTIRDPLKRTVANKNHLNWIEFFNMEQFMEWFNKI